MNDRRLAPAGGAAAGWQQRLQQLIQRRVLYHLVLCATSLLFALPIIWLIATSFKTDAQVVSSDTLLEFFVPNPVAWDNYSRAMARIPLWRYLGNTALVTGLSILGTALASSLVAFAFARYRWPGRDAMFLLLLSTMMLPPQVTMIPVYLIFARLGLVDTFTPLWLPSLFGTAFYIFLLRQSFKGLPRELFEAAEIDGASPWRTFFTIALPLVRPALIAVIILQFMASWNDFLTPLIYLQDQALYTLSLGLQAFSSRYGETEWGPLTAASLLMIIPVFTLFFAAQKYFIQGIALAGMKE
ncbi:MAG: carbohydrate ABC transporter permease [candidate division KSB1 bacterium]|nr:carbohydrate ABC transporter permease [candidate division KSB1 bacterium]MDZ7276363.1 carbohydrate ABC transporter permease [candidate division KSB1 bacterium]MDZ7287685.1 carbohydrate ABC transporter permease [candidate division KSB1 bacterium]MDZ7299975.1 carbohydrate ABC transporter permease [candidate division KSB1 bacterium]MDZ7307356.1 carbohydrate ABC transporter permease [candidate division KSB1 bacterium]